MATTFDVIYLGVLADMDTVEGDSDAENAGALVGLTLGSSGDPLHGHVQSFSPGTTGYAGGDPTMYNTANEGDNFSIDGGADQTHDMTMLYDVTITYVDGSTATATAILTQDTDGNTYLVPQSSLNANQEALEAAPIESITLDAAVYSTGSQGWGLFHDRYDGTFSEPVDGTSGDDTMGSGDTDTDGDQIDGADGNNDWVYGYGGHDSISGGDGDDRIDGGDGNDTLVAGLGSDTLFGGDGDDLLIRDGTDVNDILNELHGGAGNDTIRVEDGVNAKDQIDGGDGVDTFELLPGDDRNFTIDMVAGDASDGTIGTQEFSNIENITAGGGDDTITGDSGDNVLKGGAGSDVIDGGAGDDSLEGSTGNDSIDGGDGADLFTFQDSFGSDTIAGGEGGTDDDTIDLSALTAAVTVTYTGFEAGTITDGSNTVEFSEIENITTTDFADYVDGTSSASDLNITAGDGDDTIFGGTGDDTVYGGDGTDRFYGAGGDNTFYGGAGSDRTYFHNVDGHLEFHAGEDVGETDNDTLDIWHYTASGFTVTYTGDEAGTFASTDGIVTGSFSGVEAIQGTVLDDTVDASSSTDSITLTTFAGDDSVLGSSGDDSINLREGSDTVSGGAGDDTIDLGSDSDRDVLVATNLSGSDEVKNFDMTDFGDGTTIDQIDVSGLINGAGNPVRVWDVVVTDTNGDGTGHAILTFPNGESITLTGVLPSQVDDGPELLAMGIPCFTAGTRIATPTGETAVELLRTGDLVTTLEYGSLPVRWIASSQLGNGSAPLPENVMPVRIKPGAMGNHAPLVSSPQHCILMADGQKGGRFYVRAKHLAEETRLASYARGRRRVTYVHVLLDRHAILISNGIPSESFYPGSVALAMLSSFDRMKLDSLIPGLTLKPVEQAYGPRAAPVLKRADVRKMAANGTLAFFQEGYTTA